MPIELDNYLEHMRNRRDKINDILYHVLRGISHEVGPWSTQLHEEGVWMICYRNLPVACVCRNRQFTILLTPEVSVTEENPELAELVGATEMFSFCPPEPISGHNFDRCSLPDNDCDHVRVIARVGLEHSIIQTLKEMVAENGEEW